MIALFVATTILLRGEVQNATGVPIAGAHVAWSSTRSTTTGADGRFTIEPGTRWPEDLVVSANGLGTRVVAAPRQHSTSTLGPIRLLPAATLRVHLLRPHDAAEPLDLAVGLPRDDDTPRWIVHRHVDGRTNDLTIPNLGRGAYVVFARGASPMERATVKAIVVEGAIRDVDVGLAPRRLRLRVTRNGEPLENTEVHLGNLDAHWDATVVTNEKGEVDTPMWDGGRFEVAVHRLKNAVAVMRMVNLDSRHGAIIDLPSRSISGVVTDHGGTPVMGAMVILRSSVGDGFATARMRTDQQGRFLFDGVERGAQSIHAVAGGYLLDEPLAVSEDQVHITLSYGYPRNATLFWSDGTPAAGAEIVCVAGDRVRAKAFTNDRGEALIATPSKGRSVLYVIPEEGSFFVERLGEAVDDASGNLAISIPRPTASLLINALTVDGKALLDLGFIMRLNGEIIPPVIADEIEHRQGIHLSTGDDGSVRLDHISAGTYEFWPYRDQESIANILDSIGIGSAPVSVNVTPGENHATVRFQVKR